jgi:hypothetical protein
MAKKKTKVTYRPSPWLQETHTEGSGKNHAGSNRYAASQPWSKPRIEQGSGSQPISNG